MPTACINQSGSRIRLVSERLEILGLNEQTRRDEVLREIPIRDLDRLIITETVQITSQALATLLRHEIPISVIDWNGSFLGAFHPAANAHGQSRLRQYRRAQDDEFSLKVAGRVVTAKLYNQRRGVQRLTANRGNEEACNPNTQPSPAELALAWLDGLFASINRGTTVDEIRGYEGAATARYFHAWSAFLPADFPFEYRSTRPPHNAVNSCISFGATLLYSEATAFIHAHGLDPALGFLHSTENGRWSLALDLIEPFRPVLVEALALDLFSHQILNTDHFESKNGGVYLNEDGRKKFFLQYERRMERQFMSESVGHRTTLRQQLEHQAVMLKSALENPDKFEPFLMN